MRLPGSEGLPLPYRVTEHSSGFELFSALGQNHLILPEERFLIPTGFAMAIPVGYEGQIRPRSGKALSDGLTVLNSPGTIDADYRGEIKVLLINHGKKYLSINRGDRIAQIVIAPVPEVDLIEVLSLDETSRGEGGFGHSGG